MAQERIQDRVVEQSVAVAQKCISEPIDEQIGDVTVLDRSSSACTSAPVSSLVTLACRR